MEKELNDIDTKDNNARSLEEMIIVEAVKKLSNPFINLTVSNVAKDLKMSENTANKLFKRKDFPSVNIGKQKTVTLLAYLLWKMKHQDDIGGDNNGKKSF